MTQEQVTAQKIIAALKGELQRYSRMRARLAELRATRDQHLLTVLLPAERAYRDAERVAFGLAVGIAELERALKEEKEEQGR